MDRVIQHGGGPEDLIPDGIHPNAYGHRVIAKAILDEWGIPSEGSLDEFTEGSLRDAGNDEVAQKLTD